MTPLEPEKYYHIYNHANGKDNLFSEGRNYSFFLQKYKKHIIPIAQTLAYCLMPNHFHFLIQINDEKHLRKIPSFPKFEALEQLNNQTQRDYIDKQTSNFLSKQFSNFFSSYTQAYNQSQNRRGSLFYKNFRRKEVTSEEYLIKLVNYIHFNPVVHGFCTTSSKWKYSSFQAIVSNKNTLIERENIIEWFGGLDNFLYCHRYPLDINI